PDPNLGKELSTIRVGGHSKFNINYHIVWIPKYRKPMLGNPKLKKILEEILRGQSESRGWNVIALEIMPDHIHLFLSVPPNTDVSKVVNQLKGNTSIQLRRIFPELKAKIKKHLWARGYYVSTAGFISQEQVQRYIDAQQKKLQEQRMRRKQGVKVEPQRTLAAIPPLPKGSGSLAVA
ncbi:MAG TPA: IS200/IS605 family transposase, partial [Bacteroidia bacterium]|nr:IS200/IS605 family transposase [Bacteroidia bacterium]